MTLYCVYISPHTHYWSLLYDLVSWQSAFLCTHLWSMLYDPVSWHFIPPDSAPQISTVMFVCVCVCVCVCISPAWGGQCVKPRGEQHVVHPPGGNQGTVWWEVHCFPSLLLSSSSSFALLCFQPHPLLLHSKVDHNRRQISCHDFCSSDCASCWIRIIILKETDFCEWFWSYQGKKGWIRVDYERYHMTVHWSLHCGESVSGSRSR